MSHSCRRIVSRSWDEAAKVWEITGDQPGLTLDRHKIELLTIKGHSGWIFSAAFSPDGKSVVTGSGDRTAKVWEAVSAEQVARWQREEQAAKEK